MTTPSNEGFALLDTTTHEMNNWSFLPHTPNSPHVNDWPNQQEYCFTSPPPQPTVSDQDDVFSEFFPDLDISRQQNVYTPEHTYPVNNYDIINNYEVYSPHSQENIPQWSPAPISPPVASYHPYYPKARSSNSNGSNSVGKQPQERNHSPSTKQCSNCKTTASTMWRWNLTTGDRECNACNLYEKKTGRRRPEHLWNKKVFKRQRRSRP